MFTSEVIVFPGKNRKTHCSAGHAYTPENTAWKTNSKGYSCRECRECGKLRMRRKREHPDCRARGAARQKLWRETHPEEYKAQYTASHEQKKKVLDDARTGGCIKCGESDVACLDFHHREGKSNKLGHIGEIRRFSIKRILEEIAKCDVLCANCHRKHHRDERLKQAA